MEAYAQFMEEDEESQEPDYDLFTYLEKQDNKKEVLDKLYRSKWACLSILRSLPPIAKLYVTRLVSIDDGFPEESMLLWVEKHSIHVKVMKKLQALRIVFAKEKKRIVLHSQFRRCVKELLVQDTSICPWYNKKGGVVDQEQLEAFAQGRWDQLLYYIVGSKKKPPHQDIKNLLKKMKIMANPYHREGELGDYAEITNKGYDFMLRDIHEQIWMFLRHYTKNSQKPEEILEMIFCMSYCNPGDPCEYRQLSEGQQAILYDFKKFGLVYFEGGNFDFFYPTSLGTRIVFGQSQEQKMIKEASLDGKVNGMFVIVETNFKCYVYTFSDLHKAMLSLFLEIECVLPNMVVGNITRDSVRNAFAKRITSNQIIHFLENNAHPLCRKRHKLVPDNITDQIILWERERNRVIPKRGNLYEDFSSKEQFEMALQYAKKHHMLHWSSVENQQLFVLAKHHESLKEFLKNKLG
mmetsp:Transcript_5135/g.6212  ORF Transcript_5135/g.6212 Transcript_5135/m.6212 type:complete len:464 (+) Transcript_5135:62-1453(+)|eukprot:CAMPEP_0184033044 /NCGR_PEP_ID=MMETSP0955-20130417/3489_1 /TAXON_ID=627963 /ORGANISM="Aplanochytrium sp, Strain PBS07" /LENGTH=463 /DNA_ID=CAMNT_0026319311 /DNA_START=33 /DNA_END=1424 /DNA_ORIENTATION=+